MSNDNQVIVQDTTDIGLGNIAESANILETSTRQILRFLVNNTTQSRNLMYIEDMLTHEDYVIFFYIKAFSGKNIDKLTRSSLDLALTNNAAYWVSETSIYNTSHKTRQVQKIPKDYIASKVTNLLTNTQDYARALQLMVLQRYDIIANSVGPDTFEDMQDILEGHKMMAQMPIAVQILTQAFNIVNSRGSAPAYLRGMKYGHTEVLEFMRDSATEALSRFTGAGFTDENEDDRASNILQLLAGKTTYADPIFHWNLGLDFLPNFLPGWTMFLSAPEKEGKTRFALGEVVYPALSEGKNVTYMSGEMDDSAIYAVLVVKHLLATRGINLGSEKRFAKVLNIIIMTSKIIANTITPAERKIFDSYKRNEVELILSAFKELILSDSFGRLDVLNANLNVADGDKGGRSANHRFYIENLETDILTDLRKQKPGKQTDLLVIDHAGHFVSNTGLTETKIFRQVYQTSVRLAKNAVHPIGVMIINHLNTEQASSITSVEDLESTRLRSFGTSEAGKSADIDISLFSTPDNRKDGRVSLVVNNLRWADVLEKFGTKLMTMSVDRGACEYTAVGSTKSPYRRKVEGDDALI